MGFIGKGSNVFVHVNLPTPFHPPNQIAVEYGSIFATRPRSSPCFRQLFRGSIKRTIDAGSGSGDLRAWCSKPKTRLGRYAVELVGIPSQDSKPIGDVNSTA